MSNLGGYQKMTTWAKKVGGSKNLVAILLASGAVIYKVGEVGVKEGIKIIKSCNKGKEKIAIDADNFYVVKSYGKSNEGLEFNAGDRYKVLESDEDAILIDKIGDSNNPYFLSSDFLRSISDFE